jgi:SAM-dependent methyltransferase
MKNINDVLNDDFIARGSAGRVMAPCLIDLGCGEFPYEQHYKGMGAKCFGIDRTFRPELRGRLTCADCLMLPLRTASVDVVVCTEVLEHLPDPRAAAQEIARVVRPGGVVLMTTPFLHGLHEVPHDYYRFTKFGLEAIFSPYFAITSIESRGGSVALLVQGLIDWQERVYWVLRRLTGRRKKRRTQSVALLARLYMAGWTRVRANRLGEWLASHRVFEVLERKPLGYMMILSRRCDERAA